MEVVITLLVVGAVLLLLETVLPGMVAGVLGLPPNDPGLTGC